MNALVDLPQAESTLFNALGYRIHGEAILSQGLIHVTDQRLRFQSTQGCAVTLERSLIVGISQGRFGFLTAWSVETLDDDEVSLIVPDSWQLGQALRVMFEGRVVVAPVASRSQPARLLSC